jgi:hypothetical protein
MAEIDQGDIIRVVLRQTLDARSDIQNVIHWQCAEPGGITNAQCLEDAADWWDDILDQVESFQSTDLTYDEIYCYNETKGAPVGTTDVAGHENGSLVGQELLPAQVAGGFYGLTNISRVVGKKFFSGFTEAHSDADGLMTSSLLSALTNAAAIIWDASISYNGHNWAGGVFRRLAGTLAPVVEAFVNNVWYTQRRRRWGVGS